MRQHIGWLWIVGFFGLLAAANAQTVSPPSANTKFGGTYAFVSATKVNEIYSTRGSNRLGECTDRKAGPLAIVNSRAKYPGFGLQNPYEFEGTVGQQGELTMRNPPTPLGRFAGNVPGIEITVYGRIDGNGTVRARQMGSLCSYEMTWQKSK